MISPCLSKGKHKVKLVAVAKDESAYIPEWIFHHLYFGFSAIDIYINRTTDNSIEMLSHINKHHPMVNWFSADWIDLAPDKARVSLQYIVYSKAFVEAKEQGFDHIMFLDIDEFWTPKNLHTTIQDSIEANAKASAICYEWINEFGDTTPFSEIPPITVGKIHPLVKTTISLQASVTQIGFHMPELAKGNMTLCDGEYVVRDKRVNEGLDESLRYLRPIMVIHRAFRSPLEYVSLLNRGRPSDNLQVKLNRGGYNNLLGKKVSVHYSQSHYEEYANAKALFFKALKMEDLLEGARNFVTQRYFKTFDIIRQLPIKYIPKICEIFRGCSIDDLSRLHSAITDSPSLANSCNVENLIELAKESEQFNNDVAHIVWCKALTLRPAGPLINARISQYKASQYLEVEL